jgi:hypothetical protein
MGPSSGSIRIVRLKLFELPNMDPYECLVRHILIIKLTFGIYRKLTDTDLIIHNDTSHPSEHKRSAIKYLINRIIMYQITHENKVLEVNTISEILANNRYRQHMTT